MILNGEAPPPATPPLAAIRRRTAEDTSARRNWLRDERSAALLYLPDTMKPVPAPPVT